MALDTQEVSQDLEYVDRADVELVLDQNDS
jgi:hypothetical protein